MICFVTFFLLLILKFTYFFRRLYLLCHLPGTNTLAGEHLWQVCMLLFCNPRKIYAMQWNEMKYYKWLPLVAPCKVAWKRPSALNLEVKLICCQRVHAAQGKITHIKFKFLFVKNENVWKEYSAVVTNFSQNLLTRKSAFLKLVWPWVVYTLTFLHSI